MKILRINDELELHPVEESHAGELYKLTDDNRMFLKEWLPWVDSTISVDDTLNFIRTSIDHSMKQEAYKFAIKSKNEIAGMIGIHEVILPNKKCEIGYWLGEKFNGNGIMTMSCRRITDFSFDEIGMNRTTVKCATGNFKSQGIPRRLEFKEEGILRQDSLVNEKFVDNILFAMLKEEWKK